MAADILAVTEPQQSSTTPPTSDRPSFGNARPDPHLMDYLLLVAKRKWMAVILILSCAATALGLTYIVPYSFEASVMLLPPDRLSSSGLLSSLNAGGALKILKEVENPSVDLIQNILESRALAERLYKDSSVHRFYFRPGETHEQNVDRVQEAVLTLPSFSEVHVRATVVTGWFSSSREKEAAQQLSSYLANLAVRTMDTIIGEVLRSDAAQARTYADTDYARRSRELDSLDRLQEAFEAKNGAPALSVQTSETIKELGRLESDEDDALVRLNVLRTDYQANDPTVVAAEAEVDEARAARTRYETAAEIAPALDTLPTLEREYSAILRRKATLEPIVSFLRQEREQQSIFAVRQRSVITVLDTAKVPDHRASPQRLPMLLLGGTVGVFFSILAIAIGSFLTVLRKRVPASPIASTSY